MAGGSLSAGLFTPTGPEYSRFHYECLSCANGQSQRDHAPEWQYPGMAYSLLEPNGFHQNQYPFLGGCRCVFSVCSFQWCLFARGANAGKPGGMYPQPAFACPATAFFVQDSPSDLYSLDLSTGAFVLEKNNILPSGSNRQIQAIGYNRLDGYLYGYRSGTTDLVRIGSDYSYQLISISTLPVSGYDNGDIDSQGILYLTNGGNTIRRIDLNPNSPTYLQKLPDLSTTGTTISDWGINPVDGLLYAVNQSAVLYRYNPVTGARTTVGTIQWPVSSTNGFGGVFFDAAGNLYLFDNNTGQTFKVAATQTIAASTGNVMQGSLFLSTGVPVTASDAARCQSAPVPCPPVAVAGVVTSQPTCQVSTGSVTVTGYGSAFSFRLLSGGNYQSSPVFSTVLPGSYTVHVRETASGCVTGTALVGINAAPSVPPAPVLSATSTSICQGGSTQLTATGCAGMVNWSTGDAGTSIFVSPITDQTYSATCIEGGCASDAATLAIRVKRFPGNPSLTADRTTICAGSSVQLTATGCMSGASVNWSNSMSGSTITLTPSAPFMLQAHCSFEGCSSDAIPSIQITVNPVPSAPVLHNLIVCQGESAVLTPFGCGGTVATLHSETLISSGSFSNTITSYTMVCVEADCISEPAVGSITYLQIPDVPVITADGPTVGVCEGSSVPLQVTSCAGGNVNWSNGLSGESVILLAQPGQSYTVRCFNGSCGSLARPIFFQRP